MAIFRIIPAGDIALENGRFVMLRGAPYVRQKLVSRFRFWIGEWFRDRREGVPYRQDVFVRNPDLEVIRNLFRRIVRSVVEVAAIRRLELVYTPATRRLACDFELQLVSGEVLIITPRDRQFIVTLQAA